MLAAIGGGAYAVWLSVLAGAGAPDVTRAMLRWRQVVIAALAGVCAVLAGRLSAAPAVTVLLLVVAAAAVHDDDRERIPNPLSLAAAVAAAGCWLLAGAQPEPLIAAGVLAVLALLGYIAGGIGAGDVKMLPSVALAVSCLYPGVAGAVFAVSTFLAISCAAALIIHLAAGLSRTAHSAFAPPMLLGAVAMAALS